MAPAAAIMPRGTDDRLAQAVAVLATDLAQCLAGVVEEASRRFYRDAMAPEVRRRITAATRSGAFLETAVEAIRDSAASRAIAIEALRNRLQELRSVTRIPSSDPA